MVTASRGRVLGSWAVLVVEDPTARIDVERADLVTARGGHADWRDMSDYLVHFTSSANTLVSILGQGHIEAREAFGCSTNVSGLGKTQHSACFSEIPINLLPRLVARRSCYGVGFRTDALVSKGAGRVWYLELNTPQDTAFAEMRRRAMLGGVRIDDPIWKLTPFIDETAPNYHFEWEREWRIQGGLRFSPQDVAFLFLPEDEHARAKPFLTTGNSGAGPAYSSAILDPLWTEAELLQALESTHGTG